MAGPRDDHDDKDGIRPRRPRDKYDDRGPPPPRRRDDYDDDADRPPRRERRRYDEEDFPPRKKGGKGLLIGLIAGGVTLLLVGLVVLILVLTSGGLKDQILGTWKDDKGINYEFTKTFLIVHIAKKEYSASYKVEGNVIEIKGDDPLDKGKQITDRKKVEVNGNELVLSYGPGAKSPPLKLQRVR